MKRKNPYPGVTKVTDRHGKIRWRFRKKGCKACYLRGPYGSKEFEIAYQAALDDRPVSLPKSGAAPDSFDWLIETYRRSPDFHALGKVYKRNLTLELERFGRAHGHRQVASLKRRHVEALVARKHRTPSAANKLLKLIGRLCRYAITQDMIPSDPTRGVRKFRENRDGYHTWTDAEIARFELHHGPDSRAVLALRLILYTGASRQDVARMGWQNVKAGRIFYRRGKTGEEVDLPVTPELAETLARIPRNQMLFITQEKQPDRGYGTQSFGNWFAAMCRQADIPGRAHGMRKAGATRLANAGATEFEVMAYLGHKTPQEARTYTKKANRARLGDSGMAKLQNASNPPARLVKTPRN